MSSDRWSLLLEEPGCQHCCCSSARFRLSHFHNLYCPSKNILHEHVSRNQLEMQLPPKCKAPFNEIHMTRPGLKHDLPHQVDMCQQARGDEEEERKHAKKKKRKSISLSITSLPAPATWVGEGRTSLRYSTQAADRGGWRDCKWRKQNWRFRLAPSSHGATTAAAAALRCHHKKYNY